MIPCPNVQNKDQGRTQNKLSCYQNRSNEIFLFYHGTVVR